MWRWNSRESNLPCCIRGGVDEKDEVSVVTELKQCRHWCCCFCRTGCPYKLCSAQCHMLAKQQFNFFSTNYFRSEYSAMDPNYWWIAEENNHVLEPTGHSMVMTTAGDILRSIDDSANSHRSQISSSINCCVSLPRPWCYHSDLIQVGSWCMLVDTRLFRSWGNCPEGYSLLAKRRCFHLKKLYHWRWPRIAWTQESHI